MRVSAVVARVAYAALFTLVLPGLLVVWAHAAAPAVTLPAVHAFAPGLAIGLAGLLLFVAGTWELTVRGGGLPLNAFPPSRHVGAGVYRWIRNPMYIGATLVSAGISIAVGHSAGLWLVTPTLALGCAALRAVTHKHSSSTNDARLHQLHAREGPKLRNIALPTSPASGRFQPRRALTRSPPAMRIPSHSRFAP